MVILRIIDSFTETIDLSTESVEFKQKNSAYIMLLKHVGDLI
jgi:hypothetical protein